MNFVLKEELQPTLRQVKTALCQVSHKYLRLLNPDLKWWCGCMCEDRAKLTGSFLISKRLAKTIFTKRKRKKESTTLQKTWRMGRVGTIVLPLCWCSGLLRLFPPLALIGRELFYCCKCCTSTRSLPLKSSVALMHV